MDKGAVSRAMRAADAARISDAARVAALDRYGVENGEAPPEFQGIVELAAQVTGAPLAAIDLMTDVLQFQVATTGFEPAVVPREESLCDAVLYEPGSVVVPDTLLDERFAENPFVVGPHAQVRFYASHQLVAADGVPIGRLCVFDTEPRELDEQRVELLGVLAQRVVDVLELTMRTRQLAESNERLHTFASRVSHDLKTPLTSISMTLQLLEDQLGDGAPADPEETHWLIRKALDGTVRLTSMIDSVLDYAVFGGALQRGNVDLEGLVDDVVGDLAAEFDGVEVLVDPLPTVLADPVHLRTVVQNVLVNAARYRHPDRPLLVTVRSVRQPTAHRILVADNGIGISHDLRHRVFKRGVRLSDDLPGTGIGLETCRRVVEAHGGEMGIESDGTSGTTVWFDLPI